MSMTKQIKLTDVEALNLWIAGDISTDDTDDLLEFLYDQGLLNERGKKLRHEFWEKCVKEDEDTNN